MKACFGTSPARASGGQMSNKVADANHVSLGAQGRDRMSRQGHVRRHSQELKECPPSTVSSSGVVPRSHQRRWSADFCQRGISPVITVTKNKKEPQPPQRGVSLLQSNTASYPSFKRYSCPAIGVLSPPSRLSSSSSSSSTCSCSCSSPPPVQTSVITGHDPLGWKLRPKSSSGSARARTNRLSLQIPLPVICPEPKTRSAPNSQSDSPPTPDATPITKPPLKPKPSRRHSDSTAFLGSWANPLPVVTLEELYNVHLRQLTLSDESDEVFRGGNAKEVKATTRPRKIPPPVPEKTVMARQIAQLIAHSRQRSKTAEENIYTSVIKPKPKRPNTEDHRSLHERNTGLRVDTGCDRERSTPRFPG